MPEIRLDETSCQTCGGHGSITNVAYMQKLAAIIPEKLAAGVTIEDPQTITCEACAGTGFAASHGFWKLRAMLKRTESLPY